MSIFDYTWARVAIVGLLAVMIGWLSSLLTRQIESQRLAWEAQHVQKDTSNYSAGDQVRHDSKNHNTDSK